MNRRTDLPTDPFIDPDDRINNPTLNPGFDAVLQAGLKRRSVLRGSVGTAAAALFGSLSVAACGGGDSDLVAPPAAAPAPAAAPERLLAFSAVAKTNADTSTVPVGYTATTLFALGDPMAAGVSAYRNDGTDTGFDKRSGDCHDGIQYFGLSASGAPDPTSSDRAILGMNHEYIAPVFLHVNGPTRRDPSLPLSKANGRTASEVDIEVDCHGVSLVEVARTGGRFAYVPSSAFNRRMTGMSVIELSGPARGNPLFVTKFSPDGTRTRGSLNNCGNSKTPWGTLLTTEENWSGYYFRAAGDQALRSTKVNASFARYGRSVSATSAANSRYGWETAGADDKYARWDTSVIGTSGDGSDDYRHEHFCQGYMVEIDPYDPNSVIKKRTAMGRLAHENGAFGKPVAGQPLAIYMGCDSQNEYVYKFVSTAAWSAADASAANRVATGDKYLDQGKLYAARFNDDGTGTWLDLSVANPAVAGASFGFSSDAEVCIHTRIAADAAGATKMDRPEWVDVHPTTGEVYVTMTNNSSRRVAPTGSQTVVDAANPRAYSDIRGGTATLSGNVNGHIVRIKDTGPASTGFTWDVYLFGSEASASPQLVNLSGLTTDQDFSSPDGLAFSRSTGICWIQTDDGAYTDVTNCMMLASLPGSVGDGTKQTLNYGTTSVSTYVGSKPTPDTLKRFYVGPVDCEVTGVCETPDGKTMFINIQHPGEDTAVADIGTPGRYTSQWPSNGGYGAGVRPRSATVMITKNDGGRIGS